MQPLAFVVYIEARHTNVCLLGAVPFTCWWFLWVCYMAPMGQI